MVAAQKGDVKAMNRLNEKLIRKAPQGALAGGATGLAQLAQEAFQKGEGIFDTLERSVMKATGGRTDATVAVPGSFEEAVPIFSEASARLLKAAEELGDNKSVLGTVGAMAAGATSDVGAAIYRSIFGGNGGN
jgi:hypothetical protein